MTRIKYELMYNDDVINGEMVEESIFYRDVKFSKEIYKDFLHHATWLFKKRPDIKTVELYLDHKQENDIYYSEDILVSIDRYEKFVMVYMKNPNSYDYKMTRTFFLKD